MELMTDAVTVSLEHNNLSKLLAYRIFKQVSKENDRDQEKRVARVAHLNREKGEDVRTTILIVMKDEESHATRRESENDQAQETGKKPLTLSCKESN